MKIVIRQIATKARRTKQKSVFPLFKSSKCVMKWKLTINQKFVFSFNCFVLLHAAALINCDVFKLGYLTGSARRAGDFEYERPGEFVTRSSFPGFAGISSISCAGFFQKGFLNEKIAVIFKLFIHIL